MDMENEEFYHFSQPECPCGDVSGARSQAENASWAMADSLLVLVPHENAACDIQHFGAMRQTANLGNEN